MLIESEISRSAVPLISSFFVVSIFLLFFSIPFLYDAYFAMSLTMRNVALFISVTNNFQ